MAVPRVSGYIHAAATEVISAWLTEISASIKLASLGAASSLGTAPQGSVKDNSPAQFAGQNKHFFNKIPMDLAWHQEAWVGSTWHIHRLHFCSWNLDIRSAADAGMRNKFCLHPLAALTL